MAKTTRKIVRIDADKCNGCGACVPACAEGAIQIIDGKARLLAENLCDGLGACLGECPRGAIEISERPAEEFDLSAVEERKQQAGPSSSGQGAADTLPCGCPGTMARKLARPSAAEGPDASPPKESCVSRLGQWPVQLTLVPVAGDIWRDADVLISADCVAYAMGDFHHRLLAGKTLAVACPKLDDTRPYLEKLKTIFAGNDIRHVTVARMEVPCCAGLERLVREALAASGKSIPLDVVVVALEGRVVEVNGIRVA